MAVRHFKRYRMEFDVRKQSLLEPCLPEGYSWAQWTPELVDAHAAVKANCFSGEIDATVFPCLGHFSGCQKLMQEIAGGSSFLPAATWLIKHPSDFYELQYCGTIQGMLRPNRLGSIQNVGITSDCRGIGLGRALVAQSLSGFADAGASLVSLDVTAANCQAVSLYLSLGFRIQETTYLSVTIPETAEVAG